jgi:hypothetical protein
MTDIERERQERIETGSIPRDVDETVYQKLFQALENPQEFPVDPAFADRIMVRIKRSNRSVGTLELTLMVVGGVLLLVAGALAVIWTDFTVDLKFFRAVTEYRGLFVFAILLFLVFNWLDKKVTRKKEFI